MDGGEHISGLDAVLRHTEAAFQHFVRGRATGDDSAFTDAIYRTNQAFEGSMKEAYRVLADKDPAKQRPSDIENYLDSRKIFRTRVLSQLATYRKEWRNPSTHDHKLDFDESEAFLAIVSVSAFACLLLDQIAERLAFKKSQTEASQMQDLIAGFKSREKHHDLLVHIGEMLKQFCAIGRPAAIARTQQSKAQLIGSIHGFMSTAAPDLEIRTDAKLHPDQLIRADLTVRRGGEQVFIEVKRRLVDVDWGNGIEQVHNQLVASGYKGGLLVFVPDSPSEMEQTVINVHEIEAVILALAPQRTLSIKEQDA